MKTVKTLLIFAAFLVMVAIVVDLYFLRELTTPNKNAGAYIGIAAMIVMMITFIFIAVVERKLKKMGRKIEEKDQEIGRLQSSLEQTNEIISLEPPVKGEDVKI